MQISEAAGGAPAPGAEPCRFPKLEECAHFHYERVHLPQPVDVRLQTNMDQSLHSHHTNEEDGEWFMIQVTSGEKCWLLQRNFENFKMLDAQLHQCIFDRKISQLTDLVATQLEKSPDLEGILMDYLERLSQIVDNSLNCGPVLNWLQMDNKGHRLLVPSEESRSINTPAVAAAYSVRRYVSQAHDELNLEVGDMISVIDMANPGESMWWRGKRGFQVGFFPQHCVHIIGDKVPRNMPLPPPVVGSLALTSIKPVLRKHGKLITFFRSFILNRPSRRRLKQTGILKERVFACDLGEHLLNSGHEIPMVLKCCAEFIEKNGIVDGIYRLSGITSNIQKLRNAFDEDRIPNLYTEDILQDIHSVASLLKMYFRELPNPLCTYQLYQSFVNAVQGTGGRTAEDDHKRLLKMRETVQKLPPPHYRTLEYLMRHLARVAKHGPSTGMTTRNVAIVWAPNLLRCAELEDGGVTALQGVGVQAVVTEFLICFADLIFCDHLPNLDRPLSDSSETSSPKNCRPKSLAISTPTKLITLEEARNKHQVNRSDDCKYIEVGGGPKNLPKKYHTVIELPSAARKRGLPKRSPSGWRSFFSKSRSTAPVNIGKGRKSSTPVLSSSEKTVVLPDFMETRKKLRTVKSAESLTSGHSEPASNELDSLGPLHSTNKTPGHNRSVSHDSYFDILQNSQNNSEGSMLDLSEIQLNFDLEETEMRIFSEDESLVSSPKVFRDGQRRILTRARPEDFSSATNSGNPSPKKQARVVLSPDSISRKRTRLEDQLSDIQYIDCSTPENVVSTTTALIHPHPIEEKRQESYRPKNKSPRNSDNLETKRQSLNLETQKQTIIIKSLTEADIGRNGNGSVTPQSPVYRQLSSNNTTSDSSPTEITYQNLGKETSQAAPTTPNYENVNMMSSAKTPSSPNYENVLTTISITYKSPAQSKNNSPLKSPVSPVDRHYENISFPNPEKVVIPTSTASLPDQQASQPKLTDQNEMILGGLTVLEKDERPKSLSALDLSHEPKNIDLRANLSSSAVYGGTNEHLSLLSAESKEIESNRSSNTNVQYTPSSTSTLPYHFMDNANCAATTPTDFSMSEVLHSSTENLTSQTSISLPTSPSKDLPTPNVSPNPLCFDTATSLDDLLTPISPLDTRNTSECSLLQEIVSEVMDQEMRRSAEALRPESVADLIEFSPMVERNDICPKLTDECHSSPVDRDIDEIDAQKSAENIDDIKVADSEQIYQQVKILRRSIHEVNELLKSTEPEVVQGFVAAENEPEDAGKNSIDDDKVYDSLENDLIYETVNGEDLRCDKTSDKPKDNGRNEDKLSVKDLMVKFEESKETTAASPVVQKQSQDDPTNASTTPPSSGKIKKNYDKDGLPPCLRARNLKHQIKTRSLDEEDFKNEFALGRGMNRRKSMDDGVKNTLMPKMLNQPKRLPIDSLDKEIDTIHLTHSVESVTSGSKNEDEDLKKRERIEKYKEERRKFLQEKYRTESFKEDKDTILSRLKIHKPAKDETVPSDPEPTERSRKSSRNDDIVIKPDLTDLPSLDSLEPVEINHEAKKDAFPKSTSLKARAAVFENNAKTSPNRLPKATKPPNKFPPVRDAKVTEINDGDVVLRKKIIEPLKSERKRHTYEPRERETETERIRRVSADNKSPRKDKAPPTYCIKDMKAIFESKSKQ